MRRNVHTTTCILLLATSVMIGCSKDESKKKSGGSDQPTLAEQQALTQSQQEASARKQITDLESDLSAQMVVITTTAQESSAHDFTADVVLPLEWKRYTSLSPANLALMDTAAATSGKLVKAMDRYLEKYAGIDDVYTGKLRAKIPVLNDTSSFLKSRREMEEVFKAQRSLNDSQIRFGYIYSDLDKSQELEIDSSWQDLTPTTAEERTRLTEAKANLKTYLDAAKKFAKKSILRDKRFSSGNITIADALANDRDLANDIQSVVQIKLIADESGLSERLADPVTASELNGDLVTSIDADDELSRETTRAKVEEMQTLDQELAKLIALGKGDLSKDMVSTLKARRNNLTRNIELVKYRSYHRQLTSWDRDLEKAGISFHTLITSDGSSNLIAEINSSHVDDREELLELASEQAVRAQALTTELRELAQTETIQDLYNNPPERGLGAKIVRDQTESWIRRYEDRAAALEALSQAE